MRKNEFLQKDVWVALVLVLLSGLQGACRKESYSVIEKYSDVARFIGQANGNSVIIDLRAETFFQQHHLPQAVHIDYQGIGFDAALDTFDHDVNYFLYCNTGILSARAAEEMKNHGIRHVSILKTGVGKTWAYAGH